MASENLLHPLAEALGTSDEMLRLYFAVIGLVLLGIGFHSKGERRGSIAAPGWIMLGFYFFLDTPHYVEISDPVLILMSAAALPLSIAVAVWEVRTERERVDEPALEWFRGCTFWAAAPYLLVSWVPNIAVAVVWFTAWQGVIFLRASGVADLSLGETHVNYGDGSIGLFSEFQGNPWLYLEPLGEGGFFIPILSEGGGSAGISIILACSALQSMIVFVGALVALRGVSWKLRARAFIITLPVIHLLNVFRNGGIIYLDMTYRDWHWFNIGMFDFAHSYAAKVGSLVAMFAMAIVLFELLPTMHSHVLRLMEPMMKLRVGWPTNRKS
jgi:archaeosortase A (PGF-CTERM-specific)